MIVVHEGCRPCFVRWFIQNLLWQQSDSRCDCQIIGTNFIRSNRPALMRSPRSKVFSSLCACVDVQKSASLEMLQTLQMIRSLKLCRISSINSSVWNEMCSIKPCISLSLANKSPITEWKEPLIQLCSKARRPAHSGWGRGVVSCGLRALSFYVFSFCFIWAI